MKRNINGISPVISIVIIVSVSIAVAISVALWMSGIIGGFTKYEKLELKAAYAEYSRTIGGGYRKSHVIIGSTAGAITDYQMRIVVHFSSGVDGGQDVYLNGKCRKDFSDVRFYASDGITSLNYWIEKKVDEDYAIFLGENTEYTSLPRFNNNIYQLWKSIFNNYK